MEYQLAKMRIGNKFTEPIMIFVEPWCHDYWIQPGETLELSALSNEPDANFYFHIEHRERQITVYAEGRCSKVRVTLNGEEIEFGHNRPDHLP